MTVAGTRTQTPGAGSDHFPSLLLAEEAAPRAAPAMRVSRQVFWLRGHPISSAFPSAVAHDMRTVAQFEEIVTRYSGATAAE